MRFTSKDARALTRFVPIEPAPPVTRMVLRRKVSERSPMSLRHIVPASHPLHRPADTLFRSDLRVVLQITDRLGTIHRLRLRRKGLRVLVRDEGIVAAYRPKNQVRVGFDISLPFRTTADVVDLAGDEV